MVTPDRTEPDHQRSRNGWGMAGALVVVLAALGLIANLTEPAEQTPTMTSPVRDTVAAPSTVPTIPPFDVSQVETGPAIQWEQVLRLEDRWVVGHTYHDGVFTLFITAPDPDDEFASRGLTALVSIDGVSWTRAGEIDSDFSPNGVVANSAGIFAYGTSQSGAAVWLSADGSSWREVRLPGVEESVYFQGAAANDTLVLMIAEVYTDELQTLLDAAVSVPYPGLRATLATGTADPPGWMVELHAPLGVPVGSVSLEEVGLQPDQIEAAMADPSELIAWVGSPDGAEWRRVWLRDLWGFDGPGDRSVPFSHMGTLFSGPDGRLWGRGHGDSGWRTYATSDGVEWEEVDGQLPEFGLERWKDGYVSVGFRRARPLLRVSDDLLVWTSLDTDQLLHSGNNWSAWTLAAGDAGVAMTARIHQTREIPPESVRLERDGYTLDVEYGAKLLRGDDVVLTSEQWWGRQRYTRLSEDGTRIVFLHPKTGEELVAFTLDELAQLEDSLHRRPSSFEVLVDHHVIIFSPDGEEWTVQDLSGLVGGTEWPRIIVGDDRLVLLSSDQTTTVWVGTPSG